MKVLAAQLAYFLRNRTARRNVLALGRLLAVFAGLVLAYSTVFHFIMRLEGQEHSWVTGLYWTLVVMSTLGFGDITFHSDLGRLFSIFVLLSGISFLLVLLPFTFIQFFYAPWIEAQSQARMPRQLPETESGHVIITRYDPVAMALISRLRSYGRPYIVVEPEPARGIELYEEGVRIGLGARDDLETYRKFRVQSAALVFAAGDDYENTNVAFTIRELTDKVPIIALARAPESVDILQLAGASHVIQLADDLGRSLARRTLGGLTRANVIGRFESLVVAEAAASGTPLVGRSITDSRLREVTGVTIVGVWERGQFHLPGPEHVISSNTVLVLAGTEDQLAEFDELFVIYSASTDPVTILGAGRVGRAAARYLKEREIPYRLVDRNPDRLKGEQNAIVGTAADLEVLERAGIRTAPTVIITTNSDETNIYLTIYCRRLHPDIQIISRATLEQNVSTLHRAGADIVMSYASLGANAIFNVLEQNDLVMLAEGLDVFRFPTPESLVGVALAQSGIREGTGCSVIAIEHDGQTAINPDPALPIPPGSELIVIGTTEAERKFVSEYADKGDGRTGGRKVKPVRVR